MTEMVVVVLIWGAVLGYIGFASKETMQMTWLIGLGLMLLLIVLTPFLIMFVPAFR